MISLQASICASAGVVSDVQSGPSWLGDWASEGCDRSAASASIIITIERCIDRGPDCGSVRLGRGRFVNGSSPFAAHLKLHYEAPVKAG